MVKLIVGTAGADNLKGSAEAELLQGLAGDDTLNGGGGGDTLDGGAGFDEARIEGTLSGALADLALGQATLRGERLTLIGIEALYGGKADDTLLGDATANRLSGNDGNDLLYGRGGDDSLFGGEGSDTLVGGPGSDVLDGGAGFDEVRYELETQPLFVDLTAGRAQLDNVADTLTGIEAVYGGKGDDTLLGDDFANRLDGGAGNDLLRGGRNDDTLMGSSGNDTLDGGAGVDLADYSAVDQALHIDLAAGSAVAGNKRDLLVSIDKLHGGGGDDVLLGSAGDDWLDGGAGNDTVDGRAGDDVLSGGAGADLLMGGEGNDIYLLFGDGDTLDGGPGIDTIELRYPPGVLVAAVAYVTMINLATGEFSSYRIAGHATFRSVEAVYGGKGQTLLIGDEFDNILTGTTLVGGGGDDTLNGAVADYRGESAAISAELVAGVGSLRFAGQTDQVNVREVWLGSGDDVLRNSPGGRTDFAVDGGAGNDRLVAATMTGGLGDDTLEGAQVLYSQASGPVIVSLRAGRATGADGNDTLIGVHTVYGSAYADQLSADDTGSYLWGSDGDDLLQGGAGNDTLDGGTGVNTVRGGAGDDNLYSQGGRALLEGGEGNDSLVAWGTGNLMRGGPGKDRFSEAASGNTIEGGAGWDMLLVNGNDDRLVIDMAAGELRWADGSVTRFSGIECIAALVGNGNVASVEPLNPALEALIAARPATLVLINATSTVQGGDAIDAVIFPSPRAAYNVQRFDEHDHGHNSVGPAHSDAEVVQLRLGRILPGQGDLLYQLDNVERLLFASECLAFGERALDVAKLAFALWGPAIVSSATLMGKGIDWYDQGHSPRELVDFALSYFSALSDAELAQRLVSNVQGTHNASEVLGLITQQGRAAVAQRFADDAANLANVELAGLPDKGIVCALSFNNEALFLGPG
jgi:Ca2+-binding RTX toxin-like protein